MPEGRSEAQQTFEPSQVSGEPLPLEIANKIKARIGEKEWGAWFGPATLISTEPVVIGLPSMYRRNYVEERYGEIVKRAFGAPVKFVVINPTNFSINGLKEPSDRR